MNKKFLKPNDLRLKKISQEIPADQINSSQVKRIAASMLKIILNEQRKHNKGVGLAAPQIGIFKRIILVDVAAGKKSPGGDLQVYINPEIIWTSKRTGEWYEGCYSTGNICGIVSRPTSIKVKAFTPQPERLPHKLVTEKHTGYVARIFQHEIDHLDRKVFTYHITDPDKLHWVEEKEFPLYRNKQAWKTWPKKAPLPLVNQALKKV